MIPNTINLNMIHIDMLDLLHQDHNQTVVSYRSCINRLHDIYKIELVAQRTGLNMIHNTMLIQTIE